MKIKGLKMWDVLAWFTILLLGSCGLFVIYTFASMIFIAQITELKVKNAADNRILHSQVELTFERQGDEAVERVYKHTPGNMPFAKPVLINKDGTYVKEEEDVYLSPDTRRFLLFEAPNYTCAFRDQDLYEVENGVIQHLSELSEAWSRNNVGDVSHVAYINEDYILKAGQRAAYIVKISSFEFTEVADNIYYISERPPKLLELPEINSVLLISYIGNYSYGFGGDSSRPAQSKLRIFTPNSPQGIDLVEIPYKNGLVVDAKLENGALIITTDPSRPPEEKRRNANYWRLSLPSEI